MKLSMTENAEFEYDARFFGDDEPNFGIVASNGKGGDSVSLSFHGMSREKIVEVLEKLTNAVGQFKRALFDPA